MTPGPRLDLHVHSAFSADGREPIGRLVAGLGGLGLQGLALTDHNTPRGLAELPALQRDRPELLLLPGVEVSAVEGHLLVYGVSEAPPAHRPVVELLDWCRSRAAVPVLAHPFRWTHGVGGTVAGTAAVPALETTNGHNGARANARAVSAAEARRLGTTGGSDAHLFADLGRAWTRFPEGVATVEEALDALRKGRTIAEGRSATLRERWTAALRSGELRLRRGLKPL